MIIIISKVENMVKSELNCKYKNNNTSVFNFELSTDFCGCGKVVDNNNKM